MADKTDTLDSSRRFPPEILCQIFDLTLPHTRRIHETAEQPTAPWRLGFVCKQWRACALDHRRLWSSVHIDAAVLRDPGSQDVCASKIYSIAALETQLLRSADAPLQVSFNWPQYIRTEDVHLLALLRLLVDHSNRWERISLTWPNYDSNVLRLLEPIRGRLALLRRLEFLPGELPQIFDNCELFAVAPCLREIILTDDHYFITSPDIGLPWTQLTGLRGNFRPKHLLKILRATPNLDECGLGLANNARPPLLASPVVLSRVQRLYPFDSAVLRLLEVPQLQHLRLPSPLVTDVSPFLQHSRYSLTVLSVENCPASDLLRVLHDTPTLLYLNVKFKYWPATDDIAQIFADLTTTSPMLCPELASIQIVRSLKLMGQDYEAMLGMIASRWPAKALKCVRIFTPDVSSVPAEVQALRNEGFDVCVTKVLIGWEDEDPGAIV
ncbi:hypothetical protein C8R43DRAFT_991464 [Mycena crocata]|nr:hypothetical protein C8R43DRAFT_991464 [Mycena crocata]